MFSSFRCLQGYFSVSTRERPKKRDSVDVLSFVVDGNSGTRFHHRAARRLSFLPNTTHSLRNSSVSTPNKTQKIAVIYKKSVGILRYIAEINRCL